LLEIVPSDSFLENKTTNIDALAAGATQISLETVPPYVPPVKQSMQFERIESSSPQRTTSLSGMDISRDGGMCHVDQSPGLSIEEA
jgi:hypothetical protein